MKTPLLALLIWLLCALVPPLQAVEITDGPNLDLGETTATLRWTTASECGSSVKFGVNETALNRKEEGGVGTKHEIKLTGLQPGTKYFYSVGTSRKPLKSGSFVTLGSPPKGAAPAPAGAKPPAKTETPQPAPKTQAPAPKPDAQSKAEPPKRTPPPTRQTWGDMDTLQDHYIRHGKDFKSTSAEHYAAQAWLFLQKAIDEGLPAKLDEDGTIRIWEAQTRSFAAYNRNFTTKTYFKPDSPDYFKRQPGKPVKLSRPKPAPANPAPKS